MSLPRAPRWSAGPGHRCDGAELEALTKQRAVLTRAWRVVPVAICALVPAFVLSAAMVVTTTQDVDRSRVPIDERAAGALLWHLALADRAWIAISMDERESIERALATRYRDELSDGRLFTPRNMDYLDLDDYHQAIASDVLRRYPQPLPDRQDQVDTRAAAIIRRATQDPVRPWYEPILSGAFQMYLSVAVLALVVNFAVRRGLIRMMGLELVTSDGRPASRLRVLARTAITWSPVLMVPFVISFVSPGIPPSLTGTPWWMLVIIAGAVFVVITPARGVQDRIAGTWVVPRWRRIR